MSSKEQQRNIAHPGTALILPSFSTRPGAGSQRPSRRAIANALFAPSLPSWFSNRTILIDHDRLVSAKQNRAKRA